MTDVTNELYTKQRGNLAGSTVATVDQPIPSAVSWGAIFAGALAAAALSLILLILGTGLGLSSVSPWAQSGVTAATFGVSTILWITLTQLAASGMGGYLAGRLRIRWTAVGDDEVYFRDTAHGFLAWALATLVTAAFLTSTISSIVSGGVQAGGALAGGAAATGGASIAALAPAMAGKDDGDRSSMTDPTQYLVDALFRKDPAAAPASGTAASAATNVRGSSAEVLRIFSTSARTGPLPADDQKYVAQVVAQQTGLSPQEADKRVTEVYTRLQTTLKNAETSAREAADKARKASAYGALWLFISLLMGAFFASWSATLGGQRRDD